MQRRRDVQDDYAVHIQPRPQGCDWTVICIDGQTLSGQAPTRDSARRCGAFAGSALRALDRIGRRRF